MMRNEDLTTKVYSFVAHRQLLIAKAMLKNHLSRLFVILLLAAGALGKASWAQGHIVIVQADHPVEPDGSAQPLTEPYVAVHPDDPQHLVAGTIVATAEGEAGWRCAAFTSRNGGASWHRHDFDMERCIDP